MIDNLLTYIDRPLIDCQLIERSWLSSDTAPRRGVAGFNRFAHSAGPGSDETRYGESLVYARVWQIIRRFGDAAIPKTCFYSENVWVEGVTTISEIKVISFLCRFFFFQKTCSIVRCFIIRAFSTPLSVFDCLRTFFENKC